MLTSTETTPLVLGFGVSYRITLRTWCVFGATVWWRETRERR